MCKDIYLFNHRQNQYHYNDIDMIDRITAANGTSNKTKTIKINKNNK